VVQHHPNRAGTDLRGIWRNSLRHRSILSRVGASGKPGAVHLVDRETAVRPATIPLAPSMPMPTSAVLPGLVPGIHVWPASQERRGRDKPGQNDQKESCSRSLQPGFFPDSPAAGGRGQGQGQTRRFAAPATSPSRCAGPSLSPLKGGEGCCTAQCSPPMADCWLIAS